MSETKTQSESVEAWSEFNQYYPPLIASIGESDFLDRLSELATALVDYDSLVVMSFSTDKAPVVLHNDSSYFKDQVIDKDFMGAMVLDPFYQLIRRGVRQGIFRLEDIAPDEFYSSDYYNKIYKQTGLQKEIGIISSCNDEFCLVLSIGLRNKADVEVDELKRLNTFYRLIQCAICKHFEVGHPEQRTIGHQLNDIFSNFGKDFLSERECQVTQLVLQGYSTKAIAPLLEVSTETVKVYRKRIHNKLKISSQSELFSLFLEAASTVPADSNIDPLTVYFGGKSVH
ncbi:MULTISPECIES: helix-turn-helix transcriptional regulator [Vibrio]|uniref:helix-turn-helix transcriptional regulator n=1 Tax=Vibrio TaxID=662 RepID=UPI001F3C5B04|nr:MULTISPECIES: helix-turn-helix transcriptional regulator [Vibrio]USD59286.1 helix-turn-helix transcriptional regulator [Vibrio sp. SCSIO 43140]